MNFQFESKTDGSQQTPSHTMKTFFDTLSDSLQIRTKSSKETSSHYDLIRTWRLNPTRSRLLQPLQKWNCSPQRSSNSQKMKNYRSSNVSHSRKTTSIRKFAAIITKFSWLFLSDTINRKSDSTTLEDLDYDEFLSKSEITEATTASHENLPLVSVPQDWGTPSCCA